MFNVLFRIFLEVGKTLIDNRLGLNQQLILLELLEKKESRIVTASQFGMRKLKKNY